MSKTGLYQVFDLVAEAAAGPILLMKKDGPAVRAFGDLLSEPNGGAGHPATHPEDYELRYLGEQNDQTGELYPATPRPETITTGTAWAEARKQQLALRAREQQTDRASEALLSI